MSFDPPVDLSLEPTGLGLVTDLYQLTMMAGYDAAGMSTSRAVFEVFVRRLPNQRSYLIFAGLEQAIGSLQDLRFQPDQVEFLRHLPSLAHVAPTWFDQLLDFRLECDVWAVPEGSVVFPGEPLVRVEGPLPQAQLVETLLLASLGYPTLVASKASRIVAAAGSRPVFDFGARRGHGIQASFLAARAAYLAGFAGTSQVEAGRRLQIPVVGTMAHAWVQAFATEKTAFKTFSGIFPGSTLLVDTYDTEQGVRLAAGIEPSVRAIRIDSGDLAVETKRARAILDAAERSEVAIIASGDLDEFSIRELMRQGAPIDQFGVGTELITSGGAPSISMVYKLVACNGTGRIKKSPGKRTYPLAKQITRQFLPDGTMQGDHIMDASESSETAALLVPYLRGGKLVRELPNLEAIREFCRAQRNQLPEVLRDLDHVASYPVSYSEKLEAEAIRLGL